MCMDCMWDAGIERIGKKKTRRRRRVSSSYSGRFWPCTGVLTPGIDLGSPEEAICTSWEPLAAGNATTGEARDRDCKIAVCHLDFWRW